MPSHSPTFKSMVRVPDLSSGGIWLSSEKDGQNWREAINGARKAILFVPRNEHQSLR